MIDNAKAAQPYHRYRESYECGARKQSLPEPADCNWPFCGCDEHANKVIEALQESGWNLTIETIREARILHVIADAINRAFNERDDLKNLPSILQARAASLDSESRSTRRSPNADDANDPS